MAAPKVQIQEEDRGTEPEGEAQGSDTGRGQRHGARGGTEPEGEAQGSDTERGETHGARGSGAWRGSGAEGEMGCASVNVAGGDEAISWREGRWRGVVSRGM
eukprot:scaffold12027_cov104-Isochrysis_galbana.AAC.4